MTVPPLMSASAPHLSVSEFIAASQAIALRWWRVQPAGVSAAPKTVSEMTQ